MKAKLRLLEMAKVFCSIYDTSEAEAIAGILLEFYAGIHRSMLIRNPDLHLESKVLDNLKMAEQRILQQEPVQYVTGEAYFMKQVFQVSEAVLIPRPETEELVYWALDELQEKSGNEILDIGTGSGCIAISIKQRFPEVRLTAIDLSAEALKMAQLNAKNVQAMVQFEQMDFLEKENWKRLEQYDMIISNPPYIPQSFSSTMDKHVLEYEPTMALFVPDEDPLLFYRKIAVFGKSHLKESGMIFLELHAAHAHETETLFREMDYHTMLKEDMFGKPRMLRASLRQ
jgi:release factor glutamine methyltransferase